MIRREQRLADGRILAWCETGSGPSLVLLHGWSLSGAAFTELAALLSDFHVFLPDLPGHGGSSPLPKATLPALADAIEEWLTAVRPGPVLLGGWSLGGMVALELAARGTTTLNQLLLLATTPRFTGGADWPHGLAEIQIKALRRNLERHFERTLGEFFAMTFAAGEVNAERLRSIRAFAVCSAGLPDRETAAACLGLLAEQDQRSLLAKIGCPALVLHGSLDRITPVAAGRELAAGLPRGALRELAGAGHAPFWTQPREVAGAVREFCAWGR